MDQFFFLAKTTLCKLIIYFSIAIFPCLLIFPISKRDKKLNYGEIKSNKMLDSDEINKERISEVSVGEVAIGKEGAVGSKGGQRSRRHQGRSNGGRNGRSFGRQNNWRQQFGTIFASKGIGFIILAKRNININFRSCFIITTITMTTNAFYVLHEGN